MYCRYYFSNINVYFRNSYVWSPRKLRMRGTGRLYPSIRFRGMNTLANVENQPPLKPSCRARCRAGANFNRFLNPRIYRRPTLAGLFKTSRRSIRRRRVESAPNNLTEDSAPKRGRVILPLVTPRCPPPCGFPLARPPARSRAED